MLKKYLPSDDSLEQLSQDIQEGMIGIYPTDTVYGIGAIASPSHKAQLEKVFAIKKRDIHQTLPLLISSNDDLSIYGSDVSHSCKVLTEAFWPGALTVVVKASELVPKHLLKDDGSIALRMPNDDFLLKLIGTLSYPLATTSANLHGQTAPHSFIDIHQSLLDQVDYCVDGGSCKNTEASSIVSFMSDVPEIIRLGALSRERIESLIGRCSG